MISDVYFGTNDLGKLSRIEGTSVAERGNGLARPAVLT